MITPGTMSPFTAHHIGNVEFQPSGRTVIVAGGLSLLVGLLLVCAAIAMM
jgi:hypothetical protein